MSNLPLNDVVNVKVSVGPVNKVRSNFDLGLIIGKSTYITTDTRIKTYNGLNEMKLEGFSESDPEYLAANLYFSQSPAPKRVCIGVIGEGETIVDAVTDCRTKNAEWYIVYACDATDEEILSLAQYVESSTTETVQFYTTSSSDVLSGAENNLMGRMKSAGYHRSLGQYSTEPYAAASMMGYALGNSDTSYVLAYKSEPGVQVEDLDQSQITLFKSNYMNYYVCRGSVYNVFEMGTMADGTFFDELINLDMLNNELQSAIMNALINNDKVPQTNDGIEILNSVLVPVLDKYVNRGFIAPGTWNGKNILTVKTGDVLATGYLILNDSIDEQTQTDREARKAPNTYILLKLAGAIQYVAVNVYINR